jgi:hypothetical protein
MEKGVPGRFKSYDWHVVAVDGHDADAINKAIEEAKAVTDKPSLSQKAINLPRPKVPAIAQDSCDKPSIKQPSPIKT